MPPTILPRHLSEAQQTLFTVADRKLNMAKAIINRFWLERLRPENERRENDTKTSIESTPRF